MNRHTRPTPLLTGQAGLYRCDSTQAMAAQADAAAQRHLCAMLELGDPDEAALLHGFAAALRFPEWYGANWDALADCLTDLSWLDASGYLIILRGTAALRIRSPRLYGQLLDLLRDASAHWSEEGTPFWVLLEDAHAALPELPTR